MAETAELKVATARRVDKEFMKDKREVGEAVRNALITAEDVKEKKIF